MIQLLITVTIKAMGTVADMEIPVEEAGRQGPGATHKYDRQADRSDVLEQSDWQDG